MRLLRFGDGLERLKREGGGICGAGLRSGADVGYVGADIGEWSVVVGERAYACAYSLDVEVGAGDDGYALHVERVGGFLLHGVMAHLSVCDLKKVELVGFAAVGGVGGEDARHVGQ